MIWASEDGFVIAAQSDKVKNGQGVTLAVRPEKAQFVPQGANTDNELTGEVESVNNRVEGVTVDIGADEVPAGLHGAAGARWVFIPERSKTLGQCGSGLGDGHEYMHFIFIVPSKCIYS